MPPFLGTEVLAVKCRVCQGETTQVFEAMVMKRFRGRFCLCNSCGFLQAESPDWLEEAYRDTINLTDTGLVKRNLLLSKIAAVVITFLFDPQGPFVDYGGGYGLLTRLMRDMGLDFYWMDPHTDNLLARGFEYHQEIGKPELVTAFEVLEHLVNPLAEIEKVIRLSSNILFSTILLPKPLPRPGEWWYYGLEHGQHVAFYSSETLSHIAREFGLTYVSSGFLHLFTKKTDIAAGGSLLARALNRIDGRYSLRAGFFREVLRYDFGALVSGAEMLFQKVVCANLISKTESDAEFLGATSRIP